MPEDEACGSTHKELQAENQWWLSHLQATYCIMLLPCQTLPRAKMSSAFLSKYQTQTQATTTATKVCICRVL